ncbi:MAG TPA: VOC family protein [Lentimicrobium sp.]|nr:VOC family protein [Lentimicrobium sp.]
MKESITPCLWFNGRAREAAEFYTRFLPDTKITAQTQLVTEIEISGHRFTLLDGGPIFQPNPSISFSYQIDSIDEINRIWEAFKEGSTILMDLDKYPWSEKYGWLNDKFGISWQFIVGDFQQFGQKVIPALLFTQDKYGRAEEAINFYSSVFKNPKIDGIFRYEANAAPEEEGKIAHSQIEINGQKFQLLESKQSHQFTFSEGVSLMIHCDTQEEIDYYWDKLTEGGEESMCGWLKDKFGVSWQVVPDILLELMNDPSRADKAMKAFMNMRKLIIKEIVEAV